MQEIKTGRVQTALILTRPIATRSLLAEQLRELGISALVEATTPQSAHDYLGMTMFDAIFVKVASARDEHFHFIREVRRDHRRNVRVPIIVVSASPHADVVHRTRDIGANGLLAKPFSRAALQLQLLRIVNDPRPFIESRAFLGPDRRRWQNPDYTGPERRRLPATAEEIHLD